MMAFTRLTEDKKLDDVAMEAGSHSSGVGIAECPALAFGFPLHVRE